MTTCFEKSCLFSLQCVSFVNVYQFVFPFGFEGAMWDLIVLVLNHCLFFTLTFQTLANSME